MVKSTQITGFNGVSVGDLSTAALQDTLHSLETRINRYQEEVVCVQKELKKRGA